MNINFDINKNEISLKDFIDINVNLADLKYTYFIRNIGYNNKYEYLKLIENSYSGRCLTIKNSLYQPSYEESVKFSNIYDNFTANNTNIGFSFNNIINIDLDALLIKNYNELIEIFKSSKKFTSESIIKNFGSKIIFWINKYFPLLFKDSVAPKLIYCGNIKEQEYLFLYLLAKTGCNILYINPEKDIQLDKKLLELSYVKEYSFKSKIEIPDFVENKKIAPVTNKIKIPPRPNRNQNNTTNNTNNNTNNNILEYEELAKKASSVVMINVFENSERIKTGSGVVIAPNYIVTNFHVINGGTSYSINIENDSKIYFTSEIVKYNKNLDLALIKIDKTITPIKLYTGQKDIVRGQKVVAIGSPLGLFNSVSDGIIAGFREINNVAMIQFTAPISHGSSGGALLNMSGELIGISTSGFDDGQNINFAVSYKSIIPFVRGFVKV